MGRNAVAGLMLAVLWVLTGCTLPRTVVLHTVITNDVPVPPGGVLEDRLVFPFVPATAPWARVFIHSPQNRDATVAFYRDHLLARDWILSTRLPWNDGLLTSHGDSGQDWYKPGTGEAFIAWRERRLLGLRLSCEYLRLSFSSEDDGSTTVWAQLQADYFCAEPAGVSNRVLLTGLLASPGLLALPWMPFAVTGSLLF